MIRSKIRAGARGLAVALGAVAAMAMTGDASAHPGHATPHLLHEADAIAPWWIVGMACAVAVAALLVRKDRS